MLSKRIRNHSILRLGGDGTTSPVIPAATATEGTRKGIMPTVEEINTFGVNKDALIQGIDPQDKKFVAPYPGLYTFTAVFGVNDAPGFVQASLFHFRTGKQYNSLAQKADDFQAQVQVGPVTIEMQQGDRLSFDGINRDTANDAGVSPHSSGYSFEVRFTKLPL